MKNKSIIENLNKSECCGCSLCEQICPVNAITMERGLTGWQYPYLNDSLCINCGKCLESCPMKSDQNNSFSEEAKPDCYGGFYNREDVLLKSASGGIFTFIVEEFLRQYPKGYVAGAIYNKDYTGICHIVSCRNDDIEKMKTSKYFQSDKNNCFRKIEALLKNGFAVLFTGTPCEVRALHLFLGKDYMKLWTCDFICKGPGSPKILKDYSFGLQNKYGAKIINMNMRFKWKKIDNWIPQFLKVDFENGKYMLKEFYNTELGLGFRYLQRESCYNCPYREKTHAADITLGDFHGVNPRAAYANSLGTSVILINTQKMKALWKAFDKTGLVIEKTEFDTIYEHNRNKKHPKKAELEKLLNENINAVRAVYLCMSRLEKIKKYMPVMILRRVSRWKHRIIK